MTVTLAGAVVNSARLLTGCTVTATVVEAPTLSRITMFADPATRPMTVKLLPVSTAAATLALLLVAV